jgi:RNA polymerase sigma-70 factor (ECF subfamily)
VSLRGGNNGSRRSARDERSARTNVAAESSLCSTSSVSPSEKRSPDGLGGSTEGDTPARDRLDELVRAHSPYVAGLAYRLLGRDAEVDDVVQDVFVALLRFHASVREANALRGWLATTTVRLSLRRLRARKLRLSSWLGLDETEPASVPALGASAEEHAALGRVHRALAGVSASTRVAWLLRYVEQERMDDVARLVGCSLTTAKRRVEAAQIAVKRALDDG